MKVRTEKWTDAAGAAWVACQAVLAQRRPWGESAGVWEARGRRAASGNCCCFIPAVNPGNSCLSRILFLQSLCRFNPLPANRGQLKRAGEFPGFPGNFPGVYGVGGCAGVCLREHSRQSLSKPVKPYRGSKPAFTGLISRQKIKVNQAGSRWLKVNQGILKHFFMQLREWLDKSRERTKGKLRLALAKPDCNPSCGA